MEYLSHLYLPGAVAIWSALFFALATMWGYARALAGAGDAGSLVFARRAYGFFAFVTFYVGQTVAFGDVRERTFTEVGALLKVPLCFPSPHECDWGFQVGAPKR